MACDRVQAELGRQRINVSVSRAGSTLLDFQRRQLAEVVRASVHCYNLESEVDAFLAAVAAVT